MSARLSLSLLLLVSGACARTMPRPEPHPAGINAYPALDSVTLSRQRCTGRAHFDDPRCEAYTVRVLADGRTVWEGHQFVAAEGRREAFVSPEAAAALIAETERRMAKLRLRQCGVDHAHYVQVELGRSGAGATEVVRGCGVRFQRLARPIDRVAKTHQWR